MLIIIVCFGSNVLIILVVDIDVRLFVGSCGCDVFVIGVIVLGVILLVNVVSVLVVLLGLVSMCIL